MRYLPLFVPWFVGTLLAQAPAERSPLTPPVVVPAGGTVPLPELAKEAPTARPLPLPAPFVSRHTERQTEPVVAAPAGPALPDHVVFDRPTGGDELWAIGDTWKARFTGRGFEFVPFFGAAVPQNFPLQVELQRASVGGLDIALSDGRPEAVGSQVRTGRGGLVEVVDTAMTHVEQSFVFAKLPNRGAVTVEIRLAGEYESSSLADGLRFRNAHGAVDYTGAIARDASGAAIALPIDWTNGTARIEIPATFVAAARLPLVLDPVVSANSSLAPGFGVGREQRNPDVAKVGATTCVVWTRDWSATDADAVVQLVDANLGNAGAAQYLDFTSENWFQPRVAPNNFTQKFLCVAQVNVAAQYWIAGRLIDTAGVLENKLDLERSGVAGHLPGNKFRPDVGGDAYLQNAAAFYTLVFEVEASAGNHDIYYKQVNQDGTLRHVTPIPLATGSNNQSNPSIGSSNGPPGLSNRVLIAWQSTSTLSSGDEDLWGAYVEWNGNLLIPAFQVTSNSRSQRHPSVSGVASIHGTQCQMVAFEEDWVSDNDIMAYVLDMNGALLGSANFSAQSGSGAYLLRNQVTPSVDTDGVRFVLGCAEYSGTDYDAYVSTVAFLPTNGLLRIDEDRVPVGANAGTDDQGPSVFAEYAANAQPNPYYLVATTNVGGNDIELRRYGGFTPAAAFQVFNSQCGALPIVGSGVPALGSDISFSLTTSSSFSGFAFGFPAAMPLGVCACLLGVDSLAIVPGPIYGWRVPSNPTLVNTFTLSIQGFAFGGTACLGAIDLSNTLDFSIH
jgi:hypothetical protein